MLTSSCSLISYYYRLTLLHEKLHLMNSLFRWPRIALIVASAVSLSSCVAFSPQDTGDSLFSQANRPTESQTHRELLALPKPVGRISAAVYSFSDLTGQNKPSPASSFSSAVTQGATNYLVKALLDSGWFTPLERNGLQNVLTERNLWNQRLANQQGGGRALSPMPAASIILAGGIVAYEFNVKTGGFGAKYLGIGGSTAYREDSVTISLRAINAQDGSILHSVNSSKSVFSRTVNTGLFGFIEFDKIAELEGGYSVNEQAQRSVQEAIESGLIDLILQGILNGSWRLADLTTITAPEFSRYLSDTELERYRADNIDAFNDTKSELPEANLKPASVSPDSEVQAPQLVNSSEESQKLPGSVNKDNKAEADLTTAEEPEDVGGLTQSETIKPVSSATAVAKGLKSSTEPRVAGKNETPKQEELISASPPVVPLLNNNKQHTTVSELLLGQGISTGQVGANTSLEGNIDGSNTPPINRVVESSNETPDPSSKPSSSFVYSSDSAKAIPERLAKAEISVDENTQPSSAGRSIQQDKRGGDNGQNKNDTSIKQLPVEADAAPTSESSDAGKGREVKGVILYAGRENNVEKGRELYGLIDRRFDGVDVQLIRVKGDDDVYRVKIGPLNNADDASLVLGELKNMGVTNVDAERLFD